MSANIIRLLPDEERALLECYVAGSQHPASFQQLFDTMEVPTDAVPDRLQIAVAQILLHHVQDGLPQWNGSCAVYAFCDCSQACRHSLSQNIRAPCNIISATRTSITPSDTPSFHPTGSATSGEISVDWRPSPAPRVGTGTVRAHLKRAWMRMRQIRPPGRGDFWIQKIAYAPSDKNLSKNGFCPLKGGSLCVKDVFAKKFFGAGRDSAGGALASVLRKHSSEGRTPDTAERCIRHCAGSRPPRGTGTCCPDSERTAPA
jgi:hypothetical protein